MEQKVYNLIILDESGSMNCLKDVAVSGVNETLQTIQAAQKEHCDQIHYVSLITFNSMKTNIQMCNVEAEKAEVLKIKDYNPNSGTPLFDAIGLSISKLKEFVGKDDVVLVTIITDGMENASKEYNGKTVKRMITDLKEKGWLFTYIGTNQDVDVVAGNMDICNKMSYEYSQMGATKMFVTENKSRKRFYDKLAKMESECILEDYDYFGQDSEENRRKVLDDTNETSKSIVESGNIAEANNKISEEKDIHEQVVEKQKMFARPFSFKGRIRRLEYFLSCLIYNLWLFVIQIIVEYNGNNILLLFVLFIPALWFMIAQGAKRCHDRDNNGFWQFIPLYYFWMLLGDGDEYENDYGKEPKGRDIFA